MDRLEEIRANVARGHACMIKNGNQDRFGSIDDQFHWLVAEVDRTRKIEDAIYEWSQMKTEGHALAWTNLCRALRENPRPTDG